MRVREAIQMLADSHVGELGPTTWADLGCGDGTFTRALAHLLAPGSTIHAIDRDANALRRIPTMQDGVSITTHQADFIAPAWPFGAVDGLLMANSLHYVQDQAGFLRTSATRMHEAGRIILVEYDTDIANPWVPYPVSRRRLSTIVQDLENATIENLGTRPSVYRRAELYAVLITVP